MIRMTKKASTVLRDVPVQLCLLEKRSWSLQQWLRPKDLFRSAGRFCLQVLSPSSQALLILVSCRFVLTLTHALLLESPSIGMPAAQRWLSNSASQLQSDHMSRIYQVQFRLVFIVMILFWKLLSDIRLICSSDLASSNINAFTLVLRLTLLCWFLYSRWWSAPSSSRKALKMHVIGVARGGPGVPVTPPPLCKPSCKQTTYNIQVTIWWVPSVWVSVTPPLKNPGYAHACTLILGRWLEVS